ncbi:MAG: alpha/beta hydrolase [Patescibacteria group bacterium]
MKFDNKTLQKMIGKSGKIEEFFLTDKKGDKVYIRLVAAKQRSQWIVILPPGLGATTENSGKNISIPGYIKMGVSALSFDFYGHGKSSGDFYNGTTSKNIMQLELIVNHVYSRGFRKVILYGSSFPAFAAFVVAAKMPDKIKLLISVNPIFDIDKYLLKTRGENSIKSWETSGYIYHSGYIGRKRLGYSYYRDIKKYPSYKTYLKEITIPTLWIASGRDQFISAEEGKENAHIMRNSKFIKIEGVDHTFSYREGGKFDISDIVFNFVKENIR